MLFWDYILLELFKLLLLLVSLLMTWLIGQKILAYWEEKKKRREIDIMTINQFQQLCGEFKTVGKLWNAYTKNLKKDSNDPNRLPPPKADYCWDLLDRATKAEGNVEAILIKLATERDLNLDSPKKYLARLGLFRKTYQELRKSIRRNELRGFRADSAEYYLFDELSCECLYMLSNCRTLTTKEIYKINKQIHLIKDIRTEHWDKAVEDRAKKLEEELNEEVRLDITECGV